MWLNKPDGKLTSCQCKAVEIVRKRGGVYFKDTGFPDFSDFAYESDALEYTVDLGSEWAGKRFKDTVLANKIVGLRKTPTGYDWHHIEHSRKVMLVNKLVHSKVGHTGGVATAQV